MASFNIIMGQMTKMSQQKKKTSHLVVGPRARAKMAKNLPHLWHHLQKIRSPKPKHIFSLQTQTPTEYFKGLDSSLAQSTGELWICKMVRN